jgi:hypothetical protein
MTPLLELTLTKLYGCSAPIASAMVLTALFL